MNYQNNGPMRPLNMMNVNRQDNRSQNHLGMMKANHGYEAFAANRAVSPAAVMLRTQRQRDYQAHLEEINMTPGFENDPKAIRRVIQESLEVVMMNLGDLIVK